jgi:hypothetical protein
MITMPEQKRRGRKRASGHTRRQIIKLTGATAALSGITVNAQAASGFATGDQNDDSGTTSEVTGGHADNEGSLQWSGGDADNDEGSSESDFKSGSGDPNDDGSSERDFNSENAVNNDDGTSTLGSEKEAEGNDKETTQTGTLDVIDSILQNNTHIAQWLNPLISALMIFVTYFLNRTDRDKN